MDEYVFQRLLLFSIPSLHGLIALPLTLTIAMSIRQGGGAWVVLRYGAVICFFVSFSFRVHETARAAIAACLDQGLFLGTLMFDYHRYNDPRISWGLVRLGGGCLTPAKAVATSPGSNRSALISSSMGARVRVRCTASTCWMCAVQCQLTRLTHWVDLMNGVLGLSVYVQCASASPCA